MIELRHVDVRHFVIPPSSERLQNQMLLHQFDVIRLAISIMSGHNDMRYKYCRICVGICMQSVWRFGGNLCNRPLGVHEPKWTSHVKRPCDVA